MCRFLIVLLLGFLFSTQVQAKEKIFFSFEKGEEGWEIPDWALEKEDYVGESLSVSEKVSKDGKKSLELMVAFPGAKWTAAYINIEEYFDWTPYSDVSLDVYLPATASPGLKGKIILTVGENWEWTEMSRAVSLKPGEWTNITANLKPGSTDWRKVSPTDEFRADVRKLGLRIESNMRPAYTGPIYIDNVKLIE